MATLVTDLVTRFCRAGFTIRPGVSFMANDAEVQVAGTNIPAGFCHVGAGEDGVQLIVSYTLDVLGGKPEPDRVAGVLYGLMQNELISDVVMWGGGE